MRHPCTKLLLLLPEHASLLMYDVPCMHMQTLSDAVVICLAHAQRLPFWVAVALRSEAVALWGGVEAAAEQAAAAHMPSLFL
jgi:hypothetical protein